ncbi:hypothetical protein PoMZ_12411 [Pyricularia oryzae]|uniref:Uncharacterized protein n=1 Tax=Pyricularia oryzae TaxID=318829 RepID=A0A4P7NSU6_PYROR|nr:hypothetical protein PoMZ_12411 [Pyricularia oryzae]
MGSIPTKCKGLQIWKTDCVCSVSQKKSETLDGPGTGSRGTPIRGEQSQQPFLIQATQACISTAPKRPAQQHQSMCVTVTSQRHGQHQGKLRNVKREKPGADKPGTCLPTGRLEWSPSPIRIRSRHTR